jgi:hypothetical protein
MQAVQQFPKFGECDRRCQRRPNGKVRVLRRVGNPRRESANRAVRQLAENILTFRELRPPFNAKALTVKWMKGVTNLDDLGTMGIMFLSRAEPARATWPRPSDRLPFNRVIASSIVRPTSCSRSLQKPPSTEPARNTWNCWPQSHCLSSTISACESSPLPLLKSCWRS